MLMTHLKKNFFIITIISSLSMALLWSSGDRFVPAAAQGFWRLADKRTAMTTLEEMERLYKAICCARALRYQELPLLASASSTRAALYKRWHATLKAPIAQFMGSKELAPQDIVNFPHLLREIALNDKLSSLVDIKVILEGTYTPAVIQRALQEVLISDRSDELFDHPQALIKLLDGEKVPTPILASIVERAQDRSNVMLINYLRHRYPLLFSKK